MRIGSIMKNKFPLHVNDHLKVGLPQLGWKILDETY